jgi:hypothetical protein
MSRTILPSFSTRTLLLSFLICCAFAIGATAARAQSVSAVIRGRVTDSAGGVLQGAIVTAAPNGGNAVTDKQGTYSIVGLPPASYTVQVHYVGFEAFTKTVDVAAGAAIQLDASLSVAGHSEEILVTSERPRGEAQDINRQRTAESLGIGVRTLGLKLKKWKEMNLVAQTI